MPSKSWRERGFVRDSDDEEDTTNNDIQESQFSTASSPLSCHSDREFDSGEFLGDTDHYVESDNATGPGEIEGLGEDGQHIWKSTGSPGFAVVVVNASKPTIPYDADQRDQDLKFSGNTAETRDIARVLGHSASKEPSRLSDILVADQNVPRDEAATSNLNRLSSDHLTEWPVSFTQVQARNLRTRRPIQLHPYALESEQYRQTLRARGVRPVQVTIESQTHGYPEAADQEYSSDPESQQTATGGPLESSSPFRAPHPKTPNTKTSADLRNISSSPLSSFGDDELPDLDGLLRFTKRRKINHAYSDKATKERLASSSDQVLPLRKSASPNVHLEDVFDVPLSSPPPDHNATSAQKPKKFFLPKGAQSIKAPAAAKSSAVDNESQLLFSSPIRPRRGSSPQYQSHDIDQAQAPGSPIQISEGSISNSDTESEEEFVEEDRALKKIGKRLKGVLPRSWVKLDLQKQIEKSTSKDGLRSVTRQEVSDTPHRGVALPKPRRASTILLESPTTVIDLDNSDSSHEDVRVVNTDTSDRLLTEQAFNGGFELNEPFPDDPGMEMEDDIFDFMLPSASRRDRVAIPKKRQLKLKDTFQSSKKRDQSGLNSLRAPMPETKKGRMQLKSTTRSKISRARPSGEKLSILDAIDSDRSEQAKLPDFIRLASRQAKRKVDLGRQSPSQKHIRLQTREDTVEANETLSQWRSGQIQAKLNPRKPIRRQPLTERTANLQHPVKPPVKFPRKAPRVSALSVRMPLLQQTLIHPRPIRNPEDSSFGREQQKLQGRIATRSKHLVSYRTAQLESLESDHNVQNRRSAFHAVLRNAERQYNQEKMSVRNRNSRLDSFIEQQGHSEPSSDILGASAEIPTTTEIHQNQAQRTDKTLSIRQPRKRPARRLDVDIQEFRQPEEPNILSPLLIDEANFVGGDKPLLQGLGTFGTRYSTDYDICPLAVGTYFHESTFIGSGEFKRGLSMDFRDFDAPGTNLKAVFGTKVCTWSSWDEQMATNVRDIFQSSTKIFRKILDIPAGETSDANHKEVATIPEWLRKVIFSNSNSLNFSDPIDRNSCIDVFQEELKPYVEITAQVLDFSAHSGLSILFQTTLHSLSLQLGLAAQLLAIAHQTAQDSRVQKRQINELIEFGTAAVIRNILRSGMPTVREFLERNRSHVTREAGIPCGDAIAEAIVVAYHVLDVAAVPGMTFWAVVNKQLLSSVNTMVDIPSFESVWLHVFSLLPFLELESSGIVRVGKRFEKSFDDWSLIKGLLTRVFALCSLTPSSHGANEYVRTNLRRCHHLVQGWGWKKCDLIIGVIFDFFAHNKLAPLKTEEIRGSPKFLEMLDDNPTLDITPADKSFHIFLKLLAIGIRGMRQIYPEEKVKNIIWRCLPNRGRTQRKEDDLRQEDLDALRNNHDLHCTLFWTSPSSCKSRLLNYIRDLVDHGLSHREVCRLNIKAWTNLVRFQLALDDFPLVQVPFALWFKEILDKSVGQFRLARTELELEYEKMKPSNRTDLSNQFVQATIVRNQSQVLATLGDAVLAMISALKSSKSQVDAVDLLERSGFEKVFSILDSKSADINRVAVDSLQAYLVFLRLPGTAVHETSQQTSEESQDYGEWPEEHVSIEFIHVPVFQLLSNCFGSERAPVDSLAIKLVETWANIASIRVARGEYEWSSFLDTYGEFSWDRLCDTDQKRKFTSYFYSLIIELDNGGFVNSRSRFLSTWLTSLLERESILKFQHQLTTAVLNADPDSPLLRNLPFSKDENQTYRVTLEEIRDRRLALISSILSNMREMYDGAQIRSPALAANLRQEFTTYLREMMAGMRKNYAELGQGDSVKGAYVDFVHRVIEFLQQYTADICPIDRFFTDSHVFPLPAKDPTYVVGKLRGYGTKLGDLKTIKQLAIFFQSISERAAAENQQDYLVEQLQTSMSGEFEDGTANPSLRSILCQAIFPAYLELSLKTKNGWILARPVLEALSQVLDNLIYCFSATDSNTTDTAVALIATILAVLQQSVSLLVDRAGLLEEPHVLHILRWILQTVTSTLPCLEYIKQRTEKGDDAIRSVSYFRSFSIFCAQTLAGQSETSTDGLCEDAAELPIAFADIRQYCVKELGDSLQSDWLRQGDRVFIRQRGGANKEVLVDIGDIDKEKTAVFGAIEDFHNIFARMTGLHGLRDNVQI